MWLPMPITLKTYGVGSVKYFHAISATTERKKSVLKPVLKYCLINSTGKPYED
jgi:hypothetical protein